MTPFSLTRAFAAVVPWAIAAFPATGSAQQADSATALPTVTVTVTRDAARSPLELPYAVSRVAPDSARPGQRNLSLEEALLLLPGVTVANRYNPTQDPRISIRGSGSRSAFGVRGVRVMRDGIPLTLPDGQTPVDYLDLESIGSIEVIRGSASALYGNASGGVIDVRSADPPRAPFVVQGRTSVGSFNTRRWTGAVGGTDGPFRYQGNVTRTETNGFRAYSHQRTTNAFGRLLARVAETDLALGALWFDEPLAENPGALTRAQFTQDPHLADPLSVRRGASKIVRQGQVGLTATRALAGDGSVTAVVYGGARRLENPLTFAIVDVDRTSYGASLRGTLPVAVAGLGARLSAGVDLQRQSDHRHEWETCIDTIPQTEPTEQCPTVGVTRGAPRKDQRELVSSAGPFVRGELALPGRVSLSTGLRGDYVRFEVDDYLITATDSNDSGTRTLNAVSPMFGVVWRAGLLTSLYATVSSAFETPTATELGNKPDGSAGVNPSLKPQYATTSEVGVKGVLLNALQYDLAGFATRVRDELIPFEIPGGAGRRYFRNAGRTERRGAELGLGAEVGAVRVSAAYTYARFRFTDYRVDTTNMAGKRIPGVPDQQLQASLTWKSRGFFTTLEGLGASGVYVDDRNTARAPGYAIANVRVGGATARDRPWLAPFVGVQNLFDRRYASSVSVNANGGKYYEPAPGRVFFAGLTAATGQ